MRRLAGRGIAVVFITHKLDEAFDFGDRISILRLGRKVGEIPPERLRALDERAATAEIVASDVRRCCADATEPRRAAAQAAHVRDDAPAPILGACATSACPARARRPWPTSRFAGGAGRDPGHRRHRRQRPEAAGRGAGRAAAGERAARVLLDGRPIDRLRCRRAAPAGPALRHRRPAGRGHGRRRSPSRLNLLLKQIGEAPFWSRGLERPDEIDRHARALIAAFDVRTPGHPHADRPAVRRQHPEGAAGARAVRRRAGVVIYSKPTYGLDLQNTIAARRRIRDAAEAGVATILISTDLDELLELADRIARDVARPHRRHRRQ